MRMLSKFAPRLQTVSEKLRLLARDQRGESITETLVSVLIGGLALLMLAVVIAAAVHIVTDSRGSMKEYYIEANGIAMATLSEDGKIDSSVAISLDGTTITNNGTAITNPTVDFYSGEGLLSSVVVYWPSSPSGGGS